MRLVNFVGFGKRLGAMVDENVVDLNLGYASYASAGGESRPYAVANALVPPTLLEFIQGGEKTLGEAKKVIEYYHANGTELSGPFEEKIVYKLSEVRLLAPLPSLGSRIIAMGGNFGAHRAEMKAGKEAPEVLRGFIAHPSCVVGPDAYVDYPPKTKKLDYEVECAAVIGKMGKDIPRDKAKSHIFGYTVLNDLSARDSRGHPDDRQTYQWVYMQKNWDGSKPIGPCILTSDEVEDVYKLHLEMKVSGKVRQSSDLGDMVYKFEDIFEFYSEDWTWQPGDIISSGTPPGVAMGQERTHNDTSWYLKPGDVTEATVERIGTLRTFIKEKGSPPKRRV